MIKVLITDKLAQEGIDLLNSTDGVEAVVKTGIGEDQLTEIIGGYDAVSYTHLTLPTTPYV